MAAPKIMVIDDQPLNVQLLKRKLEREDLGVATAYSGQEALDAVRNARPNLILLDVMMPDMDGIEVYQRRQSREQFRSIPVIFITAAAPRRANSKASASSSATSILSKPTPISPTRSARTPVMSRTPSSALSPSTSSSVPS